MFAQTGFTLPVLGGAKLVYTDIRTSPCGVGVVSLARIILYDIKLQVV